MKLNLSKKKERKIRGQVMKKYLCGLFSLSALILLLKDSSSDVRVKGAEAMSKLFDF